MCAVTSTPLFIDAVRKRFGAVTAVDGVSLEILPGTCFGLLGPNGAGKSTLIRSIMGRVRPDSGSIRIFGHPVSSAAARADLGWVPQELAVYPLLTCRENLHAFGRYQACAAKRSTTRSPGASNGRPLPTEPAPWSKPFPEV